jgi:site-specific DNA-methyltransferase (adenine-specific)
VLKPGGHLLAFAGTRTQHRMAVRIEDAGFDIRDMLAWVYSSGFPKSHDVSKALDGVLGKQGKGFKAAGDDGRNADFQQDLSKRSDYGYKYTPTTDAAKQWQGFGTALKPALEPITLARKPLIGTVAANVLVHGTGGLNIDGCRVATNGEKPKGSGAPCPNGNADMMSRALGKAGGNVTPDAGRWPANFIHDGSDEVVGVFPADGKPATGVIKISSGKKSGEGTWAGGGMQRAGAENTGVRDFGDTGSASRFFYCAKASKRDRDEGLEGFEVKTVTSNLNTKNGAGERLDGMPTAKRANIHPTVKPTDLMRYLCRLITPPNGVILDPFMGSGSTGKAALLEGFSFIGCELSPEYFEIAKARINAVQKQESNTVAKRGALQMNLFNGLTHEPA